MLSRENIQRLAECIHQSDLANQALAASESQLDGMTKQFQHAYAKQADAARALDLLLHEFDLGDPRVVTMTPVVVVKEVT